MVASETVFKNKDASLKQYEGRRKIETVFTASATCGWIRQCDLNCAIHDEMRIARLYNTLKDFASVLHGSRDHIPLVLLQCKQGIAKHSDIVLVERLS